MVVSHTYFKCYEQAQRTAFLFPRLLRGVHALQMFILKTPCLRSCPVESLMSQLSPPSATLRRSGWASTSLLSHKPSADRMHAEVPPGFGLSVVQHTKAFLGFLVPWCRCLWLRCPAAGEVFLGFISIEGMRMCCHSQPLVWHPSVSELVHLGLVTSC